MNIGSKQRLLPSLRLWLVIGLLQPVVTTWADDPPHFAQKIAPIFQRHCVRCHSPENEKGGLSLATGEDLREQGNLVAGDPDSSHLVDLITGVDGNPPAMPQEGEPLSDEEITIIRQWIAAGADWPEDVVVRQRAKADASWWSLQPLVDVQPPDRSEPNPIDRFVFAKLSEHHLQPAPRADRRTLIRRLSFDLIGLPPSPSDVQSFLEESDPQAYQTLVDRLLLSAHFGERWARHWLDIAHYADTHGFERDKRRDNAWRYRDYVIRAFNEDKPYDQFLREQIAGDALAPDDAESVIATGFLAAGPWDFVGQVETKSPTLRRAARVLDLDDMLTQVMTATVAMTVNCARCHDHKLDPIRQKEYYQLTSVFAGLKRQDRPISSAAVQRYEAAKERLGKAIDRVGIKIARLEGKHIDLADVVGGGNGYGSGEKGLGIDPRTAKRQERPFGGLGNVEPGNYAASEYPFVDGVFVPAGGKTKISSTGLVATALPENSGKAWDMIRHGPVASQFSTTLGATDFNSDGHSMIGLHANAGITFDLAAIRQAGASTGPMQFSTVVGYGGQMVQPSAAFHIFLDGKRRAGDRVGRHDALQVELEIPASARFLTFLATDGGDGYSHDQISFGDPRLRTLSETPPNEAKSKQLVELKAERQRLEKERHEWGEPPRFFGVAAEPPPEVHLLVRGNPETPGEAVAPGTLSWSGDEKTFGPSDMPEGDRRVALADWIVDPQNPLTARVIVNRLWHWHFGRGIVATPSDFGFGGARPTHPELLDWLAAELIRSGWSLKHIHRLIVTSQTYQMDSRASFLSGEDRSEADPTKIDSDNRLLWRMNPRRLEAEAIRDTVLAVTNKLNPQMGGPGYRDFDYQEAYAPIYTYKTADSPRLWRRSIYRFIVRTTPQRFMRTLDCPDPANLTPRRNVTTTALQSLALFNNDFMLRQSRYFAERLTEATATVDEQIELAFRLAFARSARQDELAAARELVESEGLMHLCRALFNTNEFIYVD